MQHEDVQQSRASLGSSFAPEGRKLFVIHQHCRVNGEDYEMVVFGQHEDQRPSRLFESYGDRLSSEPKPKLSGAISTFDVPVCITQACYWSVQSIAIIAANSVGIIPLTLLRWRKQLCFTEGLVGESFLFISRRHLSIRFEAKCTPRLGVLSSDIECRATRFVAAGCLQCPTCYIHQRRTNRST